MGSMMRIMLFMCKSQFNKMTKELNHAQAKDRKAEWQSENVGDRLCALLSGKDMEQVVGNSELAPKLCHCVPWIHEVFAPYIIWCTLDSVDHTGNRIFGLPPYKEHVMLLELCKWEKSQLRAVTSELIKQGSLTTLAGAGKVLYPSLLLSLMGGHPGHLLRHDNLGHVTRCKASPHGHPGHPLRHDNLGHVTCCKASPHRHPGCPTPICSTVGQTM